ncbi:MAG TPA: hypothetical protein VM123_08405 [archaeon]|nr:hypothetical protein [archaeon]
MVEIKTQNSDLLLSREQLKKLDNFQSRFGSLERELTSYQDEFLSIMNRHYFNRENGFIEDQQGNLREVVILQSKMERLAGKMSSCAGELKSFMMSLQDSLHGEIFSSPRAEPSPEEEGEETTSQAIEEMQTEKGEPAATQELTPHEEKEIKPVPVKSASKKLSSSLLVDRTGENLLDNSIEGGEVSLKLIFEELKLTDPKNSGIVNEISTNLRKLLYDRKLVGYSKTSLVFGKDKKLADLLEILRSIFITDALCNLLLEKKLIDVDEKGGLRLACNKNRELIYIVSG